MIGNAQRSRGMFESLLTLAKRSKVNGRPALEDALVRQRLAQIVGYPRSRLPRDAAAQSSK